MNSKLLREHFRRIDESDDELFYGVPRLVVHIDQSAIDRVSQLYSERLPQRGVLLDLMSSWRSHLPSSLNAERIVGLGLNRTEMEQNPALNDVVVHNVNREPRLPFADATFDGAVLTVSVQYLVHPAPVFTDIARVLKPAAPFIVTFSNRMFPTKAVGIWMEASEEQRIGLVELYFRASGKFENIEVIDRSKADSRSDPVYAVLGYVTGNPEPKI